MASLGVFTLTLILPLFALLLLLQETKSDKQLVESICDQSQDYDFCMKVVGGDTRTPPADINGLAKIAISLTVDQVQSTSDRIPGLLSNIHDYTAQQRLIGCQSDYKKALIQFNGAYTSANGANYGDVINWVRDGTNDVIDCEDSYRRDGPIATSPITVDNHNVYKLSEIILIIVDKLVPHKH